MSTPSPSVKAEKVCSLFSPMAENHHLLPNRLMYHVFQQDPMAKGSYREKEDRERYLSIYDGFPMFASPEQSSQLQHLRSPL